MSGRITAIVFEKDTAAYLAERMSETFGDFRSEMVGPDGHMDIEPIEMDRLGEGDYVILISARLDKHTTARFTLMNAETGAVSTQVHFDLSPIIDSAALHYDDYAAAERHGAAGDDSAIDAIDEERMTPLKGLLPPYTDNDGLASELLTALDLLTADIVSDIINMQEQRDYLDEPEQDPEPAPNPDRPRYLH